MNLGELMVETTRRGIRFHLEDGQLGYQGPRGALDPELRRQLQPLKGELLELLRDNAQDGAAPVRRQRDAAAPLALSFAQQRLWIIDQLEGGGSQYNIPSALLLTGEIDLAALHASMAALVHRHDTLRSTYAAVDGAAQQRIAAAGATALALPLTDLSALDEAARQDEVRRLAALEAAQPFDLAHDLMLRVRLLRLAPHSHVLLVTLHHIAADGWSVGVIVREFTALYAAEAQRRAAGATAVASPAAELAQSLPALPVRYADYIDWQRGAAGEARLARQLDYWSARLAGLPQVHSLPLDHPRPAQQQFAGGLHQQWLAPQLLERLKALGTRHQATLFMVLHSAFALLLSRWSNERDIVIGSPIAGRPHKQFEGLVGLFVNTLVLRTEVAPDAGFDSLLLQGKATLLDAYAHQDLPFEKLVDAVRPERSLAHAPLFQVMFSMQNLEQQTLSLPGLEIASLAGSHMVAKFDLELAAAETPQGLSLAWNYAAALFEPATVERLAASFALLLDAVVAAPQAPVATLAVVPAQDLARLAEWNLAGRSAAAQSCVHDLFAAQAAATPDAPALRCADRTWTYAELNRQANRIAHRLLALGVGADTLVGLCVERSPEMMAGLLGVLKAGAAYVPLDPSYPPARLAHMLEDSAVAIVLTQKRLAPRLAQLAQPAAPGARELLCLDDAGAFAGVSDADPAVAVDAASLAYVIYTSGSTGRPKGVMVEHRSVACHAAAAQARHGLLASDVALVFSSPSVDAALEMPLCAWLAGACLHLRAEASPLPAQFLADCQADGITVADLPPAYLSAVLADPASTPAYWRGSALRLMVAGGEAFPPALLRQWQALGLFGRCRLVNAYGPTESTITASLCELDAACDPGAIALGRPLPGRRFEVLDAQGAPVPVGVVGELYISGPTIARGYLRQPELTAQKFDHAHGERRYRTGDLVRWSHDGQLLFAGRGDDQVKLRGFRVELGEIAACLVQHPAVTEALVVVQGEAAAAHLVAYVLPSDEMGADLDAVLRPWLKERLADFMLPSAYLALPAFPLLANGKIDRRALPAADLGARGADVAPATPTERALAAIWCDVLGLERVGVHAGFFELGGNSLLAMRVLSAAARVLDTVLPVRTLFEHQTVAALAAHIDTVAADLRVTYADIPRAGLAAGAPVPLSFAQQRLWFIDQLEGGSLHYNIPVALELTGVLDVAALRGALQQLLVRHQVLRSSFAAVDGVAVQRVAAAPVLALAWHDLRQLAGVQLDEEVRRLAALEAAQPFDLAHDLMLRAGVLQLGPQRHVLLVTLHHIAADGWSMGVIVREFAALYAARCAGQPDPLPSLRLQYADYAQWQHSQAGGALLAGQLDYWRARLAGLPQVHGLPLDHPRPAQQHFAGAVHQQWLAPELLGRLNALGARHQATLFMVLHSAFALLLSRWSNERDIVIGSPIAGRPHQELEGLVGLFVNTLVLRTEVAPDAGFDALLLQGKETLLDACAHQDLPFEKLVDAVRPERSLAHAPLFQVMFSMQNLEQQALQLPGLAVASLAGHHQVAKFDLELAAAETPQGLSLAWNYATALFEAATVERLAASFALLLDAVTAAPLAPVSTLALVPAPDLAQLAAWNLTARAWPEQHCVHALFEEQAAATPHAPALRCADRTWTYAELNRQANRVAHGLRALGVAPDTLVGLCVERSAEMVAGLLGVLKAGGAYVPLDPSYPSARLAYMLEDSAVAIVLTQAHLRARLADLPCSGRQLLCLDDAGVFAGQPDTDLAAGATGLTPANLAYVIYTSGSTGQPKGVMVEHAGLMNRIDWMQREYQLQPADRVLQKTPFSFDVSVWELTWPFTVGACLVMARPEGHKEPDYLVDLIRAEAVTVLHFVPSMLGAMLAGGRWAECTSVTRVFCSGEALPPALVQQFQSCHGAGLHNLYGPTEASIDVSYWPASALGGRQLVPIGKPIQNLRLHVLNPALEAVPIGVAGELHIGGVGLARGYLNLPQLTAQKFIERRAADGTVERLYKTGDLARYLPDGNLDYLGRSDFQVKLRGLRIELGEIEARLCALAAVREAAVLAHGAGAAMRLVAYLVPAHDVALADHPAYVAGVQALLQAGVPDYMVPADFVVLASMPLSANGKLDRKQLPAPAAGAGGGLTCVAPASATEQALCRLWAAALGLARVGVEDSYFALGGDSIRAIALVARMQAAGFAVSVRDLFSARTVRALALLLEQGALDGVRQHEVAPFSLLLPAEAEALAPLLHEQVLEDAYPLTRLQQGMVFHSQLDDGAGTYHDVLNIKVDLALDLAAFRTALAQLVAAHPVLRTVYRLGGERPLQLVYKHGASHLRHRDLAALASPAAQTLCINTMVDRERLEPLRFDQALWQVSVLDLGGARFQYILGFHHSILDGWSIASLNTELFERYTALTGAAAAGAAAIAPRAAPLPYRYYVHQEQLALGDAAARAYWAGLLAGAPLPWWSGKRAGGVASLPVPIDAGLSAALAQLARRLGVQERSVLLAAHLALLAIISGQQDVLTSVVSNGRVEREGGDLTLGLFLNSVPFRRQLDGLNWEQLIAGVEADSMAAQPHRHYPLAAIQAEARLDLAGSLFNYTSFHVYDRLAGGAAARIEKSHEHNNYQFTSEFSRSVGGGAPGFGLTVKADAAIFGGAFGERLVAYYGNVLAAMAADSTGAVRAPALLGTGELAQVMALVSPAPALAGAASVLAWFDAAAARAPARTAVVCGADAVSYAELDALATGLAQRLARRGAGPDTVVAVCLPRSVNLVAALLAVMKTGAAYLPLDPELPPGRLGVMLADSGAVLMVCGPAEAAPAIAAGVATLDPDAPETAPLVAHAASPVALPADAGALAYLMYTSGSTGAPKGVRISHGALAGFIAGASARAGIGADTRWLAVTTISFDIAGFELFGPLCHGGTVHLLPAAAARDAQALCDALAAHDINVLQATPATWWMLIEQGWAGAPGLLALAGGEALPADLVQALGARCGRGLLNCYGPTEATIWSHMAPASVQGADVLLGGLLPGYGQVVCDASLQPVARGVIGELLLSGASLAHSYHRRPELDAEKFVRPASGALAGVRLYRTGDLVRRLDGDRLEFLGRIDDQVKIHGYRIELGEIQNALLACDPVEHAVVVASGAANGARRLVAYVVPRAGGGDRDLLVAQLRQALRERLPAYMVPAAIVPLDALPLTANGKVDKKALPPPDSDAAAVHSAPWSATELAMCALWQAVLKTGPVSATANFFELGGDSLLATRLLVQLNHQFDCALTIKDMFGCQNLRELALHVDMLTTQPTGAAGLSAASSQEEEIEW